MRFFGQAMAHTDAEPLRRPSEGRYAKIFDLYVRPWIQALELTETYLALWSKPLETSGVQQVSGALRGAHEDPGARRRLCYRVGSRRVCAPQRDALDPGAERALRMTCPAAPTSSRPQTELDPPRSQQGGTRVIEPEFGSSVQEWFVRDGDLRAEFSAPVADPETLPVIRREGIHWVDGGDGHSLLLTLTLENPHPVATAPVPLTIGLAEFGAFIPDSPIAMVAVPGMEPGDSRRVTRRISLRGELGVEPIANMMAGGADEWTPALEDVYLDPLEAQGRERGDRKSLRERLRLQLEAIRRLSGNLAASVSHGSERRLDDLKGLARRMFQEAYDLQAPHMCQDEATHLVPQRPANVIVRSPGGKIQAHRHMGFFEHVRPGKANPMPFAVGRSCIPAYGVDHGTPYVMYIRELSDGWSAQLGPGAWGEAVSHGRYLAIVTPPRNATEGRLIVDVTDVRSNEVCPVEWYWGERADRQ